MNWRIGEFDNLGTETCEIKSDYVGSKSEHPLVSSNWSYKYDSNGWIPTNAIVVKCIENEVLNQNYHPFPKIYTPVLKSYYGP